MTERVLLIDYENVHEAGLKNLPAHDRILLFVGNEQRKANAAKPPADFVDAMMKAGKRLDLIPVIETNSNNLDFHMAYYLGAEIAENPLAEYIAISDDDDLDPLLKHLTARGFRCRRVPSGRAKASSAPVRKPVAKIAKPSKKAAAKPAVDFDEIVRFLKSAPKNRPKRKSALLHHLASHSTVGEDEIEKILPRLFKETGIAITDKGAVSYPANF